VQILDEASHRIIHQLNEDPQTLFELVSLLDFQHDVVFSAHLHQDYLIQYYQALSFIFGLYILEGIQKPIRFALAFEHFSESALA
jgi:hypothetical protein